METPFSGTWSALLRDLILEERIPEAPPGITREVVLPQLKGKTLVLIGVRRSGKTTQMMRMMAGLRQQGVARENILHMNFFDDRLAGFGRMQFQELVEAFYSTRKGNTEPAYAFLDEIQEIEGWEGFVNRAQEQLKWRIYLTGSSARMLSKEVASSMRGRSLTYELFPYSFREFLRARALPEAVDSIESRSMIRMGCEAYLVEGGFPETTGLDDRLRTQLHQSYFASILQRDLIFRNNASHPLVVRDLALKLMHDNGTLQSINRLTGTLKSMGHSAPRPFVAACLDWTHDAFLFFPVPIHTNSFTKRQANPCKWYCVDQGMVRSIVSKFTADRGRLLENMVFLSLRRQGIQPAYHRTKSGKEVDFVWKGEDGRMQLIQVCWDLSVEATREREVSAMVEAITELKAADARIITWETNYETPDFESGTKVKIRTQSAWRFLLEEKAPV